MSAIRDHDPANEVWADIHLGRWDHSRSEARTGGGHHGRSIDCRLTEAMDAQTTYRTSSSTAPASYTPDHFGPERSWRYLDIDVMQVFDVNALGVGLLGKHLIPRFARDRRGVFADLSARVGGIGDNR